MLWFSECPPDCTTRLLAVQRELGSASFLIAPLVFHALHILEHSEFNRFFCPMNLKYPIVCLATAYVSDTQHVHTEYKAFQNLKT
jgi:hypothetical protein